MHANFKARNLKAACYNDHLYLCMKEINSLFCCLGADDVLRWLDSLKMDIFTTFFHVLIPLIITFCFSRNFT